MLDQLQGIHIELTNMCTLECPRCARTKFINQFPKNWSNQNLNLTELLNFLDIDLTGKMIILSGVYGDPIYYKNLFELIEELKKRKAIIYIYTNGSYKSRAWWEELVSLMGSLDCVTFGIDGTEENFTQYRINADWGSIRIGLETVAKSPVKLVWQFIPFSFNESSIEDARALAQSFGVDKFLLLPSDRFDDSNDWLRPRNSEAMFSPRYNAIINWKSGKNREVGVTPGCKNTNSHHFISSDGYYMPCAFVGDHRFYYRSEFYKNRNMYDIRSTTISKILSSDHMINFYNTLEDAKLSYCTFNCSKI
jgi:MoaA/NifB/PqqE/SkfB family radical SAM enzyme